MKALGYEVTHKEKLAPDTKLLDIRAPAVARHIKSGQFVILRVDEKGERIPVTPIGWDSKEGTISVVIKEIGVTTRKLGALQVGEEVRDLVGPLGHPGEVKPYGKVCVIGGGVGIPVAYERAKVLKEAGNEVTAIIGARSADLLVYEEQVRNVADHFQLVTDDGSKGKKAFVTDALRGLLESGEKYDLVYAAGPGIMLKAVSETTKPYNVRTIVSLNSLMVDGTGMCGGCRVTVGGETKFTCVHGPEFDAHLVDFKEWLSRLNTYLPEECQITSEYERVRI